MFNFAFEPDNGILTVKVVGNWTLPEVDRYAREAGPQFSDARKRTGHLRLLIDLLDTVVLSQAIIEPLGKAGMQYSKPDDRVALVVNSTLMKMQMRRMIGNAPTPIFLSLTEATDWLVSDKDAASAA
ncbi:MAG: STAS/SEC14 domain-containing protein [Sphingobium sp.]|nr:STAS/SEC14 domain-containing protein [Sphingobium sp.]